MCHDFDFTTERLKDEIARELMEEDPALNGPEGAREESSEPSFLNEERETEVDLLTDGGEE